MKLAPSIVYSRIELVMANTNDLINMKKEVGCLEGKHLPYLTNGSEWFTMSMCTCVISVTLSSKIPKIAQQFVTVTWKVGQILSEIKKKSLLDYISNFQCLPGDTFGSVSVSIKEIIVTDMTLE